MVFVPSNRSGWRMILGAGSGGDKTSSLRSSQGRTVVALPVRLLVSASQDPGVTEPTLALVPRAKYRHASAAPLAGLITFRPLHSISLQFRRLHFRSIRSDGRKLPRPSKTAVRPKIPEAAMLRISVKNGNMAARLRPATKSAIARDASHGQDIGITARGSACRRGRGNNREIGHFRTASISQATLQRTETAELTGRN